MRRAAVLLLALAACGGSVKGGMSEPELASASASEPAASPEERLTLAQATECGRMCSALTACAVIDGRANASLSAEERAALDDQATLDHNTSVCSAECNDAALSPRQVNVLLGCNEAWDGGEPSADACTRFLGCLDAASAK